MIAVRHRARRALSRRLGHRHSTQWRAISTNHFIHREPTVAIPESGFSFAVKDNIATAGHPTTCASAFLRDYESPIEATVVRQLRERGGVLVGKTNMDEFGMGSHSTHSASGAVLNPRFPGRKGGGGAAAAAPRSAGGSSGGSAVAVRLGEADVALGTDTGGSVRLPAAYTGVVGYKPSYGLVSRWGVVPYANSLDTVGFLARDVETVLELVVRRGLLAEHDEKDPTSLSAESRRRCFQARPRRSSSSSSSPVVAAPGGHFDRPSDVTIGIPQDYRIAELHPAILEAWAAAERALAAWGATIVPVRLPTTRAALPAYYVLAPAEASSNLAKYDGVRYGARGDASGGGGGDAAGEVLYSDTRGRGFGDEVRRRVLLGTYSLSSTRMDNYFVQAQRVRRLVQRDFDRVFALPNPLRDDNDDARATRRGGEEGFGFGGGGGQQQFDLSDMGDDVEMLDKRGPAQVDFLLCPTAPTFPPRLDDVGRQAPADSYTNDVFTVPASLAGLPAVSVPVPAGGPGDDETAGGGVAGLQVVGQFGDDERVLGIARELSRLMPVRD